MGQIPYHPRIVVLPLLKRAALVAGLGVSICLPTPASAAALNAPSERSQSLLLEGDADYADGRFEDAVASYRASYDALALEDRAGYVGSLPLRKAVRAYERLIDAEPELARRRSLLESQHDLLDSFLRAVVETPGASQELGEELIAELTRKREAVAAAVAGLAPPEVRTAVEPEPEPEPEPDPEPVDVSEARPLNALGLGLAVGGGALLVAGIGISSGYATIRSGARDLADASPDFAVGTQARASYLADEDARARRFLIAGTVIGAVGLATAVGGIIHLALHRGAGRNTTALRLTPVLGSTHAGACVQGRF